MNGRKLGWIVGVVFGVVAWAVPAWSARVITSDSSCPVDSMADFVARAVHPEDRPVVCLEPAPHHFSACERDDVVARDRMPIASLPPVDTNPAEE